MTSLRSGPVACRKLDGRRVAPLMATLLAAIGLSANVASAEPPNPPSEVVGPQVLPNMVELVRRVTPSTAFVLAMDDYGQVLQGSGVVIRSDGWVVTSFEVVSWTTRYEVQLLIDDQLRAFDARLVRTFPSINLALLWVPATDLPVLPMAAPERRRPDSPVIGLGYPSYNQLERGLRITRGRLAEVEEGDSTNDGDLFTAEILYVGGLAGSAVCTPAGELLGLVVGSHPDGDRAVRVMTADAVRRRVDAVARWYVVP